MKNKQNEEPIYEVKIIFIDEQLEIEVIMDCRTISAHKFRVRSGFKQYDVILTKKTISANKNNEFIYRRKYTNTR